MSPELCVRNIRFVSECSKQLKEIPLNYRYCLKFERVIIVYDLAESDVNQPSIKCSSLAGYELF